MEEVKGLTVLVLGGTGEVGKELVKQLINHPTFTKVVLLTRRPYEDATAEKLDCRQIDFDNLDQHSNVFEGIQVMKCSLF